MKPMKPLSSIILITIAIAASSEAFAKERETGRGHGGKTPAPVVYVENKGLFYDSIALTTLPMKGDFQKLTPGMNGLSTEFGPGDVGYLGGRWWIDKNDDHKMDEGDMYFLCPLLGPGRETIS